MIYIITFISSCVFLGLSEKSRSRYIKKLLVFIAILLPCILAGMRADTIGTDVKVYVEPLYNAAKQSTSFSSYMNQRWYVIWRYMYVSKFEIGFTTLVYLIVKFGGSLGTVLFFIHALIVAPIYFGLKRMDKKYPIWLGMLVFYLMFYNTSLNMMRQWIAMAILFWGLSYLLTNKKKKYFIVVIVACLFHTSALMGFAIYFLYVYSQRKREYVKIANFRLDGSLAPVKVFIYGAIVLRSLNVIAVLLRTFGLAKYAGYIQGNGSIYLMPSQIILRLPIIILLIIRWKRMMAEDELTPFYGSMLVLDLLASQLISINVYAFRIASFFSEYNMLSYSALVYAGNRRYRTNRYVTLFYVLAYMAYYWVYYYAITGTHATFPYLFA